MNYILDTNVLFDDSNCIDTLRKTSNKIFIPYSVIAELDRLKRKPEKSHIVSDIIKNIDNNIDKIEFIKQNDVSYDSENVHDEQILNDVLYQIKTNRRSYTFVTNDKLFQIKAKINGIKVQDYKNTKNYKSEAQTYTGFFPQKKNIPVTNGFFIGKSNHLWFNRTKSNINLNQEIWGLVPRNIYQSAAVELLLNDDIKIVSLQGKAGCGKAQPLSSKIMTPTGYKCMGDIKKNDIIINRYGNYKKVKDVYPQGRKEIFRVTFSDKTSTECCKEHLWVVNTTNNFSKNEKVLSLEEIIDKLADTSFYIPITSTVSFESKELEVDPYEFGKMCSYQIEVNSTKNNFHYTINDFIYNSKETRINFLQGLMDTCGEILGPNTNDIIFKTKSVVLSDKFKFLIESLGGTTMLTRIYSFNREDLIVYHHKVSLPKSIIPFRNNNNKNKYKSLNYINPERYITKIESIGDDICQCLMIDSDDHTYLTTNCIVTHNTTLAMAAALQLTQLKISDLTSKKQQTKAKLTKAAKKKQNQQIIQQVDNLLNCPQQKYNKIFIVRPTSIIGDDLGFLPGDLNEKIEPFYRPIKDILVKLHNKKQVNHIFNDYHDVTKGFKKKFIEFLPVTYVRGMNIENAIVVFDDFQNTSRAMARSLLTRMGENTRVFITGDTSQIDDTRLNPYNNGLNWCVNKLKTSDIYAHITFSDEVSSRGPIADTIIKSGL